MTDEVFAERSPSRDPWGHVVWSCVSAHRETLCLNRLPVGREWAAPSKAWGGFVLLLY